MPTQGILIALTLALRLNEPLVAAMVSSFTADTSTPLVAGGLTPETALPWLRATVALRPGAAIVGYVAIYLTLQVLSIPGSALLNAMAGATLGIGLALPL